MATKKSVQKDNKLDLEAVKGQYQDYPYPYRNPEDENRRLLATCGESLAELNHFLYKGKRDFKAKFRILIAGGGTGDSSTFLGEQFKNHKDAEIIYLDFSNASMEIAKERARIRGINNITFINDSIYNIPELNLGKFDYINCCGVLHHLANPSFVKDSSRIFNKRWWDVYYGLCKIWKNWPLSNSRLDENG